MYEYCDWLKCRGCGCTNTLFKIRVDHYYKKKTGNIRYKTTRWCKICWKENINIKVNNWLSIPGNREKFYELNKKYRTNNPEYLRKARERYQKRRHAALEQKRSKYISRRKKAINIVDKALSKRTLRMPIYTRED